MSGREGDGTPRNARCAVPNVIGMAENSVKQLLPVLFKDVVPPVGVYYLLHAFGVNDWLALLGGAVVSGALLVAEAVRSRRLDVFCGFMLGVFGIGLVAALLLDDPRLVVLKASLMSAVLGAAFLISCVAGKPLTYLAYRKAISGDQAAVAALEARYEEIPQVRNLMRAMSVIWGAGLLAEAVVRAVLAYQLPVSTMVGLSTVLTIGTIALLLVITTQVAKRVKREAVSAAVD
jgi:hypothetical protein